MASAMASGLHLATARPYGASSHQAFRIGATILCYNDKVASWAKLASTCHLSCMLPFRRISSSSGVKSDKPVTKAMSEASQSKPSSGLPIDLKGQNSCILLCMFGFHMLLGQFASFLSKFLSSPHIVICFWWQFVISFCCKLYSFISSCVSFLYLEKVLASKASYFSTGNITLIY